MTARAIHKQGRMNKLEAAYAQHLQLQVLAGRYREWHFEAVKLTLANGLLCTYTPDFMVIRSDNVVEFHEVKGHWEDDARVKIKVAADRFPFVFLGITRNRGEWIAEQFTHEAEQPPDTAPDDTMPHQKPKSPTSGRTKRKMI